MKKFYPSLIVLTLLLAPLSLQAKTVSCGDGCVTNETPGDFKPTPVFMNMAEYNFAAGDSCLDSTLIRLGDPQACDQAMAPCKQAFKSCVEAYAKCNTNYTDYYGDHFLNCTQEIMDSCAEQVQETHGASVSKACLDKVDAVDATTDQWPSPANETAVFIPGLKVSVCGNGIKEAAEHCDDGNDDDLDGCTSKCQLEFHYDGPSEEPEKADQSADDEVKETVTNGSVTTDDGALDPSIGNTLAIASGSGCSLQTLNAVGGSFHYLSLFLGLTPLAWSVWRRRS